MQWAEVIGLAILVAVVLLIAVVVVRRSVIIRAGGFDVSWRMHPRADDRGWALGQARYRGGCVSLYRSLSPLPAASVTLDRAAVTLGAVREPIGAEPELLPTGFVIVPGSSDGTPFELALSVDALTALRSWVESRPPGLAAHRRSMLGDESTDPGALD